MTPGSLESILPQLAGGAPHTHSLGFSFETLEDDRAVVIRAPYRADLIGDLESGVLASGLITTLLDHAGGMAVWAAMDAFQPIATLDLRVDYMRAAEPGLDVFARARCFKLTRSVAFVRAWAYDREAGDPVAAAQGCYMLNSDGQRKAGANLRPGAAR